MSIKIKAGCFSTAGCTANAVVWHIKPARRRTGKILLQVHAPFVPLSRGIAAEAARDGEVCNPLTE